MNIKKSTGKLSEWYTVCIILLPFLYQYKGIGSTISLGELLLIFPMTIILVKKRMHLEISDKWLLGFYIVTLATTLFCATFDYFETSALMTLFIRLVFYAIVINIAREYFDIMYASRIYIILVTGFSVYLLIQYFYNMATGEALPIYLKYEWQFPPEARNEDLSIVYMWNYRASSLFLEPSYFALYVLPAICMLLFKVNKTKGDIVILTLVIAATFFSTSSAGIVGIILILMVFLLKQSDRGSLKSMIMKMLIIAGAVCAIAAFFNFSENSELITNRLQQGGSSNQRITRGWIIYSELPFFHQIFGVGLNNLEPFMRYNNMSTLYDEANLNYSASILQTLNFSGAIGAISLIAYLVHCGVKIKRTANYCKRSQHVYDSGAMICLLIVLIYIICYEAILFTYRFAFLITMIEGLQKQYISEYRMEKYHENSLY